MKNTSPCWVLICIAAGIGLGALIGSHMERISAWEIAHVNIPVAVPIWIMLYPMMAQVDFNSLKKARQNAKVLGHTGG